MKAIDILYFGNEAQAKLKTGIDKLAKSVALTMGPGGRFFITGDDEGIPNTTKDGVSVANYIELVDPIENMGANMIKQTASKTVSDTGDGTTTSIILAHSLILKAPEKITNVTQFTKGMKKGLKDTIEVLSEMRVETPTQDQLYAAALTSSNGDEEIAETVAKAVLEVGEGGVVDAIIGHTSETTCDIMEGYKMNRGYESTAYINVADKGIFELEGKIYVLLVDGKIDSFKNVIEPTLRQVKNNSGFLVVIAEDFSEDVQFNCMQNYLNYGKSIIPIKADEFGDRRKFGLEDLAIYLNEGKVHTIEDFNSDKVRLVTGTASYIKVSKDYTILRRREGDRKVVDERITQLKTLAKDSANKSDAKKLESRVSQLSGGHATIKVGASTEVEAKEKFDRYEDAIGATHAALKEGILPGGGVALFDAKYRLYKGDPVKPEATDFENGYNCVLHALEYPMVQILINADLRDQLGEADLTEGKGFNAKTGEIVDMIKEGIIDPYKVTTSALKNAVSVASLIISTGGVCQTNQIQLID